MFRQLFVSKKSDFDFSKIARLSEKQGRMLQASVHQGHKRFTSNGHQCMANALSSVIYSTCQSPDTWQEETLNTILEKGDLLYSAIVENSKNKYLLINDMPSCVDNIAVNFSNPISGLVFQKTTNSPFYTLEDAFRNLDESNFNGYIVTIGNSTPSYSSSVIKQTNQFYHFDPHSRNETGMVFVDGKATMTLHKSIPALGLFIKHLTSSIFASKSDNVAFELAGIYTNDMKGVESELECSSESDFEGFDPIDELNDETLKKINKLKQLEHENNYVESSSDDDSSCISNSGDQSEIEPEYEAMIYESINILDNSTAFLSDIDIKIFETNETNQNDTIQSDYTQSETINETPRYDKPNATPSYVTPNETPSYVRPNETPSYDRPNETPSYVRPNETQSYVRPNETQSYVRPNETQSYDKPNATPSYVTPNETPSYDKPNATPSYVTPNETPSYVRPNETPSYDRPNETPSYVRPNETQSYVRPNETQSYVRPNETQSYVRPNETQSYVRPNETQSYVRPNETPSYDGPNETPSYVRPNETPSYVRPNETPSYNRPNETPSYVRPNETQSYNRPNETPSYDGPNETPSYVRPNETSSYDGPNETQSYDRPNETQSYDRPNETQSYDGLNETASYVRPNETPSYDRPNETPSYVRPNETQSYVRPNETPSYDGPNETPSYVRPNETPSYDGPNETPSYDGPNETPSYDGPNETPNVRRSRKRVRNENEWKRNKEKNRKNSGHSYCTSSGKIKRAKILKPGCGAACKRKCHSHFNQQQREHIFHEFWASKSYEKQKEFISHTVIEKQPERVFMNRSTSRKPKQTREYYLKTESEKFKVCKVFYLETLDISPGIVDTALKKRTPLCGITENDTRGKYQHRPNTIPLPVINDVKEHIDSFPRIESHYCRKSSKKEYLEGDLNIKKLYELYVIKCQQENVVPVKESMYRHIFNTQFNLSFHKPMKDVCDFCTEYKNKTEEGRRLIEEDYSRHIKNKELSTKEKEQDKMYASLNSSHITACFDLQQVMTIPKANESSLYYSRKLNNYNLTLYSFSSGDGQCYLWNEVTAKRGSCEVASCIYKFIQSKHEEGIDSFTFYSDNCTRQNRNRYMFTMLWYCLKIFNLHKIEHKFLERGHTHNENDSIHSTIETACKSKQIYTTDQFAVAIEFARRSKSYKVDQMTTNDFYNFKKLSECTRNLDYDTEGEKIKWMEIKKIHFNENDGDMATIQYDYNGPRKYLKLFPSIREQQNSIPKLTRLFADGSTPKLSKEKFKDLRKLCQKYIIPPAYHSFYESLPHEN